MKMARQAFLKKSVLSLAFVYFSLSLYMVVPLERHALRHGQRPDHSEGHRASICAWQCAASTFVHSTDISPGEGFIPASETSLLLLKSSPLNKPLLVFHIRPPPFISL